MTKSPFEADFQVQQEKMPEKEQDAILGLQEFENSLLFLKEKKYDQSINELKKALKILKNANQEETIGYIFLLKRLAHACFLGRKYAEAEKFFTVVNELVPKVTKNPVNAFAA